MIMKRGDVIGEEGQFAVFFLADMGDGKIEYCVGVGGASEIGFVTPMHCPTHDRTEDASVCCLESFLTSEALGTEQER